MACSSGLWFDRIGHDFVCEHAQDFRGGGQAFAVFSNDRRMPASGSIAAGSVNYGIGGVFNRVRRDDGERSDGGHRRARQSVHQQWVRWFRLASALERWPAAEAGNVPSFR